MLRSLKYLFFVFFSLISLFISIIYLFFLIYKLNFKNKIVFLQPEGGFGHTISTPEVLNKLFRKDEWILIFGYNPSRHNYLIKDLYKNNFFWLQLTYSYNFPKIIFEPFKKFIFFLLSLYLNYKKIKYHYYPDYLKKFKDYGFSKYNKGRLPSYERISFKIMFEKSQNIKLNNVRFRNLNFSIKKIKKCFLGYKKSKYNEIHSINRDSDELENYKKSLFSMINNGWHINICGDLPKDLPNWFDDLKKNISFSKDSKDLNKFNLFAGINSDCYIGPMSGALSWKHMFPKKPSLIIDAYPFGWSYFNSVIAYKIIYKLNKNYKNVDNILIKERINWDNKKVNYENRYTNQDEKEKIITNFLKNIKYINKEAIMPHNLGLPKDHPITWSYSSLSKTWYKIQMSVLKKNSNV